MAAGWLAPALAAGVVGGRVLAIGLSPLLPLGMPRRADPAVGFHAEPIVLVLGLAARPCSRGGDGDGDLEVAPPRPRRVSDRPALAARWRRRSGCVPSR